MKLRGREDIVGDPETVLVIKKDCLMSMTFGNRRQGFRHHSLLQEVTAFINKRDFHPVPNAPFQTGFPSWINL